MLPTGQKLALLANIDFVLAEEEFRANPWGKGKTMDEYFEMVLAGTGSEAEARRRGRIRRAALIQAGIEVA